MTTSSPKMAALKLALMKKGVSGTARLTEDKIISLAVEHDIITQDDAATFSTSATSATPEEMPPRRQRKAPVTLEHQPTEPTPMTSAPTTQQADLVAQLLATMTPQAAPLDEQRIIELINEHSPVKRVAVSFNNTPEKEIEGITHKSFEEILAYMSCGLQLYLYGRSGAGKSHTAGQVAKSLDLEFFAQGSILAKFEALGSLTATGYNPSTIRNWLDSDGGLLCIDEIDASDPRALVTIMSIFDNDGQITFPDGVTCTRDPAKHFLIVTANTAGNGASASYNGRMRLDGAIKARFVYVEHDYDSAIEDTFAPAQTVSFMRRYRDSVTKLGLEGSQVTPRHIKMAGLVDANKNIDKRTTKDMIENICRQSLTTEQHDAVIRGMK